MNLLWSAKNNAFIPVEMADEYKAAGWVIDDAIEATEDLLPFYGKAPVGKIRGVSEDGMPEWIDIPAATEDELKEQAAAKKAALKKVADSEIEWRQYAVDSGKATAEETADLVKWQDYRLTLMRVDTSKPVWPTPPGEQAS